MKTKVWFAPIADKEKPAKVAEKCVALAELAGIGKLVPKSGLVGILQHIGEGRNIGYIKAEVTAALADRIRKAGGKPFLTGSSTLYTGHRHNACDHIMQAYDHGFTLDRIGCPIIMCDGLRGSDRVAVKVPAAKHCKEAYLGSALSSMDALIVVSHPTGHIAAGYGATIKNVAMGLASRGGKMAMHHGGLPIFRATHCTACGACAVSCPEEAIVVEKKARVIDAKCVGCGQCFTVCRYDAIEFEWKHNGPVFQERLVDYCCAVKQTLQDRILYLNVIQHFQKECDCFDELHQAECPDVGIVASRDAVAVDVAAADLLAKATGRDIVAEVGKRDYRAMFAYGESQGLGTRDYSLIEAPSKNSP